MAETMWGAYRAGLEPDERGELVEHEALLQLGALMLARVDGKSKVEYLAADQADQARTLGRSLLRSRPGSLLEVLGDYRAG